jgi:two-component system chemotaxis response regulator CheB
VRLAAIIKEAAKHGPAFSEGRARVSQQRSTCGSLAHRIIAIGAAPGGMCAMEHVLKRMPSAAPGIVASLQLPDEELRGFADRLHHLSDLRVKVAQDGDAILDGTALLSPGAAHLVVRTADTGPFVSLIEGPLVERRRPSIDMLLLSAAATFGRNVTGVILSGMGADGIQGLLEVQRVGGKTLVEGGAAILGTPKMAIEHGAADRVVAMEFLVEEILRASTADVAEGATPHLMD